MKEQERLEDLTFCRPEPRPSTVWADDLFMAVPFLLRMAEISGDETLYDEVARQILQFNSYLLDPESGLYFHGWYNVDKGEHPGSLGTSQWLDYLGHQRGPCYTCQRSIHPTRRS